MGFRVAYTFSWQQLVPLLDCRVAGLGVGSGDLGIFFSFGRRNFLTGDCQIYLFQLRAVHSYRLAPASFLFCFYCLGARRLWDLFLLDGSFWGTSGVVDLHFDLRYKWDSTTPTSSPQQLASVDRFRCCHHFVVPRYRWIEYIYLNTVYTLRAVAKQGVMFAPLVCYLISSFFLVAMSLVFYLVFPFTLACPLPLSLSK